MTRSKPKPKPLKTGRTEAQVMDQILEAAAILGIKLERRNTGMAFNPKGQAVPFGEPGDSDLTGVLPGGRRIDVEVKHEDFDPTKLRGKKREHFDRQVARLKEVNDLGGAGFWCDDATKFLKWMPLIMAGARVIESGDKLAIECGEGVAS